MEFCREREFWSSEAFEGVGMSGSETGFAQAWGHWEIQLAAKEKDTGTHERGWKGRWERRFKALPRVKLSLPFFKKTREKLLSHVQGSFILTHQALSWRGKWGWGGASWWCVMTGAFDPCSSSSFPTQLQAKVPSPLLCPSLPWGSVWCTRKVKAWDPATAWENLKCQVHFPHGGYGWAVGVRDAREKDLRSSSPIPTSGWSVAGAKC